MTHLRLFALPLLVACAADGGSSQPDAAPPADAAPAPCPSSTLCLKPFLVQPEKPVAPGRLAVVWFQPMRELNNAVEVAYDAPFVPDQPRYDIPLAQVRPPATDAVLLCQWEQGQCLHAANPPPVAFALPLVLDDTNGNGRIDTSEVTFFGNHGVGMAYLVYSQRGHAVGTPALQYEWGTLTYLGEIFTRGITAGLHDYPLANGDLFDATLGPADTADGADLALCPSAGTSCQIAAPRLVNTTRP